MTPIYGSAVWPAGGVVSAGYVPLVYALMSRKLSRGFNEFLLTQLLSWIGSVGPGAMSGRSVPAAMPLAIWLLESRLVVRWTLIPLEAASGAKTSRYALSSAPPKAVHTVTSVDDAPPVLPDEPPSEQAASRKVVPRPSATARGFSLAKSIELPPPISTPVSGRGRSRRRLDRRTFAYIDVGQS